MKFLLGLLCLCLGACSVPAPQFPGQEPAANENPSDGAGHLVTALTDIASLDDCPNGGFVLDHGFDRNGNGVLDDDEILGSDVACHGRDGEVGVAGEQG